MDILTDDLRTEIYSYLTYEKTPLASTTDKTCAETALEVFEFPETQREGSPIYKIALQYPLMDTREGRLELVKRVRQTAAQTLQQKRQHLLADDWQQLKLNPQQPRFTELSLPEMNYALDRVENNFNDLCLIAAFGQLFPDVADQIVVPNNFLQVRNVAAAMREWINDPANAEQLGAAEILDFELLPGIAPELLQLPNLDLNLLFNFALEKNQFDVVEKILNDPRELLEGPLVNFFESTLVPFNPALLEMLLRSPRAFEPELVGNALYFATENGDRDLAHWILASNREIDWEDLGEVAMAFAEAGDWESMELILESERPIEPETLGWVAEELAESDESERLQHLLDSPREIDPIPLGKALKMAVQEGHGICALFILNSNRPISPIQLARCLNKAMLKANYALFDLILSNHREIDPIQLALVVVEATKQRNHAAVAAILNSPRDIDPEQLSRALRRAKRNNDLAIQDTIRNSNRLIGRQLA